MGKAHRNKRPFLSKALKARNNFSNPVGNLYRPYRAMGIIFITCLPMGFTHRWYISRFQRLQHCTLEAAYIGLYKNKNSPPRQGVFNSKYF